MFMIAIIILIEIINGLSLTFSLRKSKSKLRHVYPVTILLIVGNSGNINRKFWIGPKILPSPALVGLPYK